MAFTILHNHLAYPAFPPEANGYGMVRTHWLSLSFATATDARALTDNCELITANSLFFASGGQGLRPLESPAPSRLTKAPRSHRTSRQHRPEAASMPSRASRASCPRLPLRLRFHSASTSRLRAVIATVIRSIKGSDYLATVAPTGEGISPCRRHLGVKRVETLSRRRRIPIRQIIWRQLLRSRRSQH